jgi:hypothetical protein
MTALTPKRSQAAMMLMRWRLLKHQRSVACVAPVSDRHLMLSRLNCLVYPVCRLRHDCLAEGGGLGERYFRTTASGHHSFRRNHDMVQQFTRLGTVLDAACTSGSSNGAVKPLCGFTNRYVNVLQRDLCLRMSSDCRVPHANDKSGFQ